VPDGRRLRRLQIRVVGRERGLRLARAGGEERPADERVVSPRTPRRLSGFDAECPRRGGPRLRAGGAEADTPPSLGLAR
jgi:hypothetical protein